MSNERSKVLSVIFCDDIRREDNGKEMLIGVYTAAIVVRKDPPITMPKLFIRMVVLAAEKGPLSFKARFVSPSGKSLFTVKGDAEIDVVEPGSVHAAMQPAPLPELGTYSLMVSFGASKPKKAGWIELKKE